MKKVLTINVNDRSFNTNKLVEISLDGYLLKSVLNDSHKLNDLMLDTYDAVVVNLREHVNAFEALIIQNAYTKNTPIYGVGKPYNNFLKERMTRCFKDTDEVIKFLGGIV